MHEKVSVIMPTWGHAEFIETAIKGVLAQTVAVDELIIVPVENDKETARVIRKMSLGVFSPKKNQCIRVIKSKVKHHIHQINLGIEHSYGDYVTVAATDDYYLPGKIASELALAKAKDAVLVYSDFVYGDQDLNMVGAARLPDFTYKGLIGRCMITDCSLVFRKMFDEFGPLDESLGSIAFFDRWLHIAERYPTRILHNPIPSFIYRRHSGQKSEGLQDKKRLDVMFHVARASLQRMGYDAEAFKGYRVVRYDYAKL